MAVMIPEVPNDFTPASQEGLMFQALQELPDEYYVFHSLRMVTIQSDTLHESETDFVVYNRKKGLLCIEAKAGHVRYEHGSWLYTAGNTAFYDVKLQYSLDNGPWFDATEATFPTEGITVTLPYPSGTGKDTHNFRVVHMFTETSTRLGTEAGKTETPAVTKTDSGLQVTLKGLSPVVIGWDKIETPSSGGSTTPAATATPAPSDNITYYTCPSCGYHNWTATNAGYRCVHRPADWRREQPRPVDGTDPGQRSGPGRPCDCQAQEAAVIYST